MVSSTLPVVFPDDDSDAERPQDTEQTHQLCWRMDPEESLSDWTIELFSRENTSATKQSKTLVATYHVHRNILAFGTHRSEYFVGLFRNKGRFAESADSTSRIELHPLAAAVFPKCLDYFYGKEINFDKESVVALHYLGEYFQVQQLRLDARAYLKEHLPLENCPTVYEHASVFKDEKVLAIVKDILACRLKGCQRIPDETFQSMTDPSYWFTVVEKAFPETPNEKQSRFASVVVSYVAAFGKEQLDDSHFSKLTDKRLLPVIDSTAACQLLEAQSSRKQQVDAESSSTGDLSCLESRCVDGIVRDWNILDSSSLPTHSCLERIKPELLAKVLSKVAEKAQQEMTVEKHRREAAETELQEVRRDQDRVPSNISVQGAGQPSVNGLYALDGYFSNACRYSKTGRWNNNDYRFYIFQCITSNATRHWYISIVPYGGNPGTSSDIDFYSAPVTRECHRTPPRRGWIRLVAGSEPSPVIVYVNEEVAP